MFNTAKKIGALLLLLRGMNGRLKRIEKKMASYFKRNGNLSSKVDKLNAKLDRLLKKKR